MKTCKRINKDDRGRLIDLNQLAAYVNMGKNRAADFGKKCGARVEYGGSVRYDLRIIDEAVDAMHENDAAPEGGSENAEN